MRAGKLDRRITILERMETGRNSLNEPEYAWLAVADAWAQLRPNRGSERFAAAQLAGTAVLTMHLRWRPGLGVQHRVVHDGVTYEIVAPPRELGRRVGLEIDMVARADG